MGFKIADNLKNEVDGSKYFFTAGDLNETSKDSKVILKNEIDGSSFFSRAGDLCEVAKDSKITLREEISNYLSLVVSGEKYGYQTGLPYSSGNIIVSFEKLKEMVDMGDNIIKAECLDDEGKFIVIEFESFGNIENNKLGRGR